MPLFALALLIGALLAVIDQTHPNIRRAILRPAHPRIVLTLVSLVIAGACAGYLVLWLNYYEIGAPSHEFRLITLIKRSGQILPLLIAAAAVGFAAVRWLARAQRTRQPHVIPHGIGVGAAGLLVFALFLMQDQRLFSTIRTVNTPVFSLEFKLAESARPLSLPTGGGTGSSFTSVGGLDPISLSLSAIKSLPDFINRDTKYAKEISNTPNEALAGELGRQHDFFSKIRPLILCLIAVRERVRDVDPVVLLDGELARDLRSIHRGLLKDQTVENTQDALKKLLSAKLPDFLKKLKTRIAQHKTIDRLYAENQSKISEACASFDKVGASDAEIQAAADALSNDVAKVATPKTPYFSILVAASLNMMNEKLAAVDELDAWLNYHENKCPPSECGTDGDSYKVQLNRIMRMRAQYLAARWLSPEPRYAGIVILRYRNAIDLVDNIFRHAHAPGIKNGVTLAALFSDMDSRKDKYMKQKSYCRALSPDIRYLVFSTIAMINSAIYLAGHFDLIVLDVDQSELVKKYNDFLGFVDPSCFDGIAELPKSYRDLAIAALVDTYLSTKLALLRQLPEERVRHEMCDVAKAVDRAEKSMRDQQQQGSEALAKGDFATAEENYAVARSLKRSILIFNEAMLRLGARVC